MVIVRDILAISGQLDPNGPLLDTMTRLGCIPDETFRFLSSLKICHVNAAVKAVGLQKACLYVQLHDEDPFHQHDTRYKEPLTEEMQESLSKACRASLRPDAILQDVYCYITEKLVDDSDDQVYESSLAGHLAYYIEEERSNPELGETIQEKLDKRIQLCHSTAFFCYLVKHIHNNVEQHRNALQ